MSLIANNHRIGVVGRWPGWGIMGEQVRLLIAYNIRSGQENTYRSFVLEDLLPQAQELGLVPTDAWHAADGNYPLRLLGFVADDWQQCGPRTTPPGGATSCSGSKAIRQTSARRSSHFAAVSSGSRGGRYLKRRANSCSTSFQHISRAANNARQW